VKGRLLIVEDDFFVAIELEHSLQSAGMDVVGIASTAEEAIRLAEAEHPDLAIMDIRLAGAHDGVEAAIELSRRLGIPSVFATAHSDERTRQRAQTANPKAWLQKPYSSFALVEAVKAALRRDGEETDV
jgi:DNA-binding NarL/FixJ family response regulator